MTLLVKNWERFQHYKTRPDIKRLTWIKLYVDLLNDYQFSELDDHTALVLVMLWLTAANEDGEVSSDEGELSFATRRKVTRADLQTLVTKGFLVDSSGSLEFSRETLDQRRGEERREEKNLLSTGVLESEFEIAWNLYPRKKGRPGALTAYLSARKSGVESETILDGVKRYAAECQGKEPQYIAHGSTWFRAKRWQDEPDPALPFPTPPFRSLR